jgi:hypothetical protein
MSFRAQPQLGLLPTYFKTPSTSEARMIHNDAVCLQHVRPDFSFGTESQSLPWAGSRATRVKVTSGKPKLLNFCLTFTIHIHSSKMSPRATGWNLGLVT